MAEFKVGDVIRRKNGSGEHYRITGIDGPRPASLQAVASGNRYAMVMDWSLVELVPSRLVAPRPLSPSEFTQEHVGRRVRVVEFRPGHPCVGVECVVQYVRDRGAQIADERQLVGMTDGRSFYTPGAKFLLLDETPQGKPTPDAETRRRPSSSPTPVRDAAIPRPAAPLPPASDRIDIAALVISSRDMDGAYQFCRECGEYVARGGVDLKHGPRCFVARKLGKAVRTW